MRTRDMAYERKPGTGVLFKNEKKQTERHPDYNGTWYDQDGQDYWLAAWVNVSAAGKKYMSLSLGGVKEQQAPQENKNLADFDKDIPF